MNFDKFKRIDMPDVKVTADPIYIKKLDRLPDKRKSAAPVLLTVSAAVLMLAVFGLWAIIGGAIRNQGEHTADPPHQSSTVAGSQGEDKPEADQLTEEAKSKLELFAFNKKVYIILHILYNNLLYFIFFSLFYKILP